MTDDRGTRLDTGKLIQAFGTAPVAAMTLGLACWLALELDGGGLSLWPGVPSTVLVAYTYGLAFAAALTVLVAVPCFLAVRRTVGVRGRIARIAGALIGAVTGFVPTNHWWTVVVTGIIGWIAAAIWWRVASGAWNDPTPAETPGPGRSRAATG